MLAKLSIGCVDIAALKFLLVGKCYGVDDEIQLAPGFTECLEKAIETCCIRNVRRNQLACIKGGGERSTRFFRASP